MVLVESEEGIAALARVLRGSSHPLTRIYAAAGLADAAPLEAAVAREASSVLLEALGRDDDAARVAANHLETLEPWMLESLL